MGNVFPLGSGVGAKREFYGDGVQDVTSLAEVTFASIQDKEVRLVEDEGVLYRFDAQAITGNFQPDDAPGSTGFWVNIGTSTGGGSALGLDAISPYTIPVMNSAGTEYEDSSITETPGTISVNNNLDIADGYSLTGGDQASLMAFIEPVNRDVMLGNPEARNFVVTSGNSPRALIVDQTPVVVDAFDGLTENISTTGTSFTFEFGTTTEGVSTSYTLHFTQPTTDVTIEFVIVDTPDNHQLYKQTLDTVFNGDDQISEIAPLGVYSFAGETFRMIVTVPSGNTNISGFDTGSVIIPNLQVTGLATVNKDIIIEQTKIEITSDLTITSANLGTYNRNLLYTPSSQTLPVVITIEAGLDIDYFTLSRLGSGTLTVDTTSPETINDLFTQIVNNFARVEKVLDAVYELDQEWNNLSKQLQTTGLLEGGVISIASGTTVDWTSGRGQVVDYSDPEDPLLTDVIWSAVSGLTPTNIATDGTTVFGYDSAGGLVQKLLNSVVIEDAHDIIWFGSAVHMSSTIVKVVTSPGNLAYDGIGSFSDFLNLVIGPANVDGNIYGANGINMNIDVAGGNAYIIGSNFRTNPKISDIVTLASDTTVSFNKVYRSAGVGLNVEYDGVATTTIDPTKYDDGSGILQTVTAGYWTIQRIFRTRDGFTHVAYGQEEFATYTAALAALGSESFTEKSPLPFTLFRCSLMVQQSATDLSDLSEAEFFTQSSFRLTGAQSATATIPGITNPGGIDKSIQFNDGGVFGGDSDLIIVNTTNNMGFLVSAPLATGQSQLYLANASANPRLCLFYNQVTDLATIQTQDSTDLSIDSSLGIESDYNTTYRINSSAIDFAVGDPSTDDDYFQIDGDQTNFVSSTSDLTYQLSIRASGTNGGRTDIHVGDRDPESNIPGNGGGLYIREDDTDSEMYLKRSTASSTEWEKFYHTGDDVGGNVVGPASATDNAIATFNGTTGELLQNSSTTITINASDETELDLISTLASGGARLSLSSTTTSAQLEILHAENTGNNFIIANSGDLDILNDSGNIKIQLNTAGEILEIESASLDTSPLLDLTQLGTNGGTADVFVGTRDPLGNVSAFGGSLYIRGSGNSSQLYLKRSNTTSADWERFYHTGDDIGGNVVGPSSSTNNSLAIFDGTTGELLESIAEFTVSESGLDRTLTIDPDTDGQARLQLGARMQLYYDDDAESSNIEGGNRHLYITNGSGMTISTTTDNDQITLETLGANNAEINLISNSSVINMESGNDDTDDGFVFTQSGTNGCGVMCSCWR